MTTFSNLVFSLYTFVIVSSLSLTITGRNVEAANRYRLPNDTVPMHYDLKLDLYNSTFDGEVQIYLRVRKPTSSIVLHSKDLIIDELITNIRKDDDTIRPKEHVYDNDTEMVRLRFENALETANYSLTLKFGGTLADDFYGLFKSSYPDEHGDEEVYIATHFQKTSARRAFPCWDEPALKATFNISIKHHSNYTALSNMPVYMEEHDEEVGKSWTHFETTPIMSTNILALVVSNFLHVSNSDNTIKTWTRKQMINDTAYFMHVVEKATHELERYLNSTVRVPKMDHVALPHYTSRATENWGLIVYWEPAVPYNLDSARMRSTMMNVMTVTHEIAHQWFGNLVSPAWWKYYWLSEGMATYLKYYITDKMFKAWALMDNLIHNQIDAFSEDDEITLHINREFTTSRDARAYHYFLVYSKPAMILWMLSHMIGEDVFQAGLLNYINEHEYSSVTSDDLWEAMQKALNQSDTDRQNFSIKKVMDTWIEQSGYPLVTVTRNYTTGDVTISQDPSPFSNDKTRRKWWIPINYATRSNPDFSVTKPTHWLKPADEKIVIQGIDVDDWIIVNLQHVGYYRVNYDVTNWKRIAEYLNTNNYKKVHVGNRVQLLNTAFHLTISSQLNPTILWELLGYLQRETDPVAWNSALVFLQTVKNTYLKSPTGAEILNPRILRLMHSFIETIDYEDILVQNDFSKLVKLNALNWACQFGHRGCKKEAALQLNAYLNDSLANKIPVDAEYWVLCMGLATANQSTWDTFFQLKIQDDELRESLKYLNCAEDPAIVAHYLNLSSTKNTTLSEFLSPIEIFLELNNDDVPTYADMEIDFLTRNFDKIANVMSITKRLESYIQGAPEVTEQWIDGDTPNDCPISSGPPCITNEIGEIVDNLIWKINTLDGIDKLKTFLRTNGINQDSSLHYREKTLKKTEEKIAQILNWLNLNANSNVTVTPE